MTANALALSPEQKLTIGENLPYIRWAIAHARDLPALMEDFQAILSATGIDGKWAAVKTLLDLIVSIGADFPGLADIVSPTPGPSPSPAPSPADGPIGPIVSAHKPLSASEVDEFLSANVGAFGDGTLLKEAFKAFVTHLPQIISLISGLLPLLAAKPLERR